MAKGMISRRAFWVARQASPVWRHFRRWHRTAPPSLRCPASGSVRNNVSSFRMLDWQDYFDNTRERRDPVRHHVARAAFLVRGSVDLPAVSHLGAADGRPDPPWQDRGDPEGREPTWRPTAGDARAQSRMAEVVEGGARQPAWIRALYLSWPYYRIHGTHDTRKIGRRSSNGCIGLYNEHIIELFEICQGRHAGS